MSTPMEPIAPAVDCAHRLAAVGAGVPATGHHRAPVGAGVPAIVLSGSSRGDGRAQTRSCTVGHHHARRRHWRWLTIAALGMLLAGCGFHLRRPVQLPAGLQRMSVEVSGGGALQRELAAALQASGVQVLDATTPGAARLVVSTAQFHTSALTVGSYARVREYKVQYHVEFGLFDGAGKPLLANQHLDMQREFTYDNRQALGMASEREQLQTSLVDDMAQAILRRVQATAGAE